jgi:hypothetical protein
MGIFGSLAVAGVGGGRSPQQPALWPQMPTEQGPPPGMDPAAWQQGEDYLNRINPGRRGADMPYTERQGDWDVTSGGFAGGMSRRNPQTGEQQYFDKRSGQWVSGPLFQQAPPESPFPGGQTDVGGWGSAPPLQPEPGPTVQGPTPMGEFGGTWGAGSQPAFPAGTDANYWLQKSQEAQMRGVPITPSKGAYPGMMLPLGFFGQGPAGWGGYGGSAAPQTATPTLNQYNRPQWQQGSGSSYAPWSTGRTFGSRY